MKVIKLAGAVLILAVALSFAGCQSSETEITTEDQNVPEETTIPSVESDPPTEVSDEPSADPTTSAPAPEKYDLADVVENSKGKYECTYAGEKHKFFVYLPEKITEDMPLIIMLHGYGMSPETFHVQTYMDKEACEKGYAVIYAGSVEAGWNGGMGDYKRDDVGFLEALARYAGEEFGCSSENVFAAGFSNGAIMTQRLASESDVFKAVACIAGMMTKEIWENKKETADISILDVYGTKDEILTNPAFMPIEDVMKYWIDANGLTETEEVSLSEKSILTKATSPSGSNEVWTVVIDKGGHSWPQKALAGFDANPLILEFFDSCKNK